MSKVKLYQTHGKVFIKSNGEKQKVEANIPKNLESLDSLANLYGENTVPVKDGDIIITQENSYAINVQDENDPDYTTISLFPNSKGKLEIQGKEIKKVILMNGLFRVETKNPIELPLANISYLDDSTQFFYIEVTPEEVSISLVSGQAEISHKNLARKVQIQMKEEVILRPSSIDGPIEVEKKFKDAYKKQREFEANFFNLFNDASFIQQKTYIADMEKQISRLKKDIKEIENEGGSAPTQMKIGVQQLEKQLKGAKKKFKEEIKKKTQKKEKEKELSQFEKEFEARERKFEKELENMARGVSLGAKSSKIDKNMSDLEKKIQRMSKELKSENQTAENENNSENGLSQLEKKIQAAGDELKSEGTESSNQDGSNDGLSELEEKIQAAGKEIEEKKDK
ncbi:MAG: hypothetical protein BAJALOKI2v1_240005 [Promethearchaeota archaeon]|nr:MAG: hypothetical protein BAJALOKI2v1_240005 [Candidatus Lokiarchaeota archaeon]